MDDCVIVQIFVIDLLDRLGDLLGDNAFDTLFNVFSCFQIEGHSFECSSRQGKTDSFGKQMQAPVDSLQRELIIPSVVQSFKFCFGYENHFGSFYSKIWLKTTS